MSEKDSIDTVAGSIALEELQFSARLDYVTTALQARQVGPFDGRIHVAGSRCSIHDASVEDVVRLASVSPALPLHTLEVAVDMRPAGTVPASKAGLMLAPLMHDFVRRHLHPVASYIDEGYRVASHALGMPGRPFNRRHPGVRATLYYGHRGIAQVRAYQKREDHGAVLPTAHWSVRVEVTLYAPVLPQLRLLHVGDLIGFDYRRHLSRAFTFVKEARRRSRPGVEAARGQGERMVDLAKQEEAWSLYGVGAFLPGGDFGTGEVRLRRHPAVNSRIGMALTRLTQRLDVGNVAEPQGP